MSVTSDSSPQRPVSDQRRRFLQALAAAGTASVAGCLGGGGDGGSPTTGGGPTTGGSGGGPTPGGGAGGPGTGAPGTGDPFVPPESERFLLPGGSVQSTFDADLSEDTDLLEGDALAAVTDFDLENRRYTLDAGRLAAAGMDPEVGRIFWISGLAMGRVTDVTRRGGSVVVETERTPLNEAIQDGVVEWDAELGFDETYLNDRFEDTGLELDPSMAGAGFDPAMGSAALVGIDLLDGDGEVMGRSALLQEGEDDPPEMFQVEFANGNTDYLFGLTPLGDGEVRVRVEMTAPNDRPANMRFTGVGTFKSIRTGGRASYAGGELQSAEIDTSGLEGEILVDIAAAGSGVDATEIPLPGGFALKYVTMVGPIPLTVETSMRLVARINVTAGASATARSRFRFQGDTGFTYEGGELIPDGSIVTLDINPESADSAGNFGQPVGIGFGVVAPRVSISIFGEGIVPYVEVGMAVNSNLQWGPVCKDAYLQIVIKAGYDLTLLGMDLGGGEHVFGEVERRAGGPEGDGCGE